MRLLIAIATTSLLAVVNCAPTDPGPMPPPAGACQLGTLPASYDSLGYEANSAVERGVRARFKALLQPMKDAEADLLVKPTAAQLKMLYAEGSPSIKALTTAYYAPKVESWLDAFAAAAGTSWTPAATPMGPGGRFGAFLFTADGTDLRQIIEKGLFAGAFYNHALTLLSGPVTPTTLDRLIAIYGAHPSFPADTTTMVNPDEFAAAYAKRRDKRDPQNPGSYLKIKDAMIRAQAALAKGEVCNGERDAALQVFRNEWERALLATAIFYLNDATKKLSAANPMPADQASALHGYGEVVGFIHGWRGLPEKGRLITDAQIDELLTLLGAPMSGTVTSYKLITDTGAELPKLNQTIMRLAAIYGFSPQQVEAFKTNY